MTDSDHNNIVQLVELDKILKKLGNFTKKEVKSIYDFFDINSDG